MATLYAGSRPLFPIVLAQTGDPNTFVPAGLLAGILSGREANLAETVHAEPPLIAGEAVKIDGDGRPTLIGCQCADCATRVFPPVALCPECMGDDVAPLALARSGRLYSYSTVHVAPRGWTVPYVAGYVDLPEGVRVFAHVVDVAEERLAMEMEVELTTAVLGTDGDGEPFSSYAFRPCGTEKRVA